MRKKSGFTLIELLVVIAIIGLISLIAIPNIIGISNSVRKDQMLDDAKKLISLAKYQVNSDIEIRNFSKEGICTGGVCTFSISTLNINGDIGSDPDGGEYDSSSYVKYYISNNKPVYCITLIGSKRTIGTVSDCIEEDFLHERSNVVDK